jgi:hypothetical protein
MHLRGSNQAQGRVARCDELESLRNILAHYEPVANTVPELLRLQKTLCGQTIGCCPRISYRQVSEGPACQVFATIAISETRICRPQHQLSAGVHEKRIFDRKSTLLQQPRPRSVSRQKNIVRRTVDDARIQAAGGTATNSDRNICRCRESCGDLFRCGLEIAGDGNRQLFCRMSTACGDHD